MGGAASRGAAWAGPAARGDAVRGGVRKGAGLSVGGARVPCWVGPWRSCPEPGLGPRRHWQVSSRHHQTRTLDYGYLLGLLEDLQAHWEEAGSLPQEQVGLHENVPEGCAGGAVQAGTSRDRTARVLPCWGAQPVGVVGG